MEGESTSSNQSVQHWSSSPLPPPATVESEKDHPDGGKLDVRVKYGYRRNVCLCEKTPPATYDPAALELSSPGLAAGSVALACDDMVAKHFKYEKTDTWARDNWATILYITLSSCSLILMCCMSRIVRCSMNADGKPCARCRRCAITLFSDDRTTQLIIACDSGHVDWARMLLRTGMLLKHRA